MVRLSRWITPSRLVDVAMEDCETFRSPSLETPGFFDEPEALEGAQKSYQDTPTVDHYTNIRMELDLALDDLDASTLFEDGVLARQSENSQSPNSILRIRTYINPRSKPQI